MAHYSLTAFEVSEMLIHSLAKFKEKRYLCQAQVLLNIRQEAKDFQKKFYGVDAEGPYQKSGTLVEINKILNSLEAAANQRIEYISACANCVCSKYLQDNFTKSLNLFIDSIRKVGIVE